MVAILAMRKTLVMLLVCAEMSLYQDSFPAKMGMSLEGREYEANIKALRSYPVKS